MAKKTVAQLEAEFALYRKYNTAQQLRSIINNAVRWSGICILGWLAYLSVKEAAGKTTLFNAIFQIPDSGVDMAQIAGLLLAIGVAYRERRLRKSVQVRLGDRVKDLEKLIDPTRTSSGLTRTGDNNPEDN